MLLALKITLHARIIQGHKSVKAEVMFGYAMTRNGGDVVFKYEILTQTSLLKMLGIMIEFFFLMLRYIAG